MINAIRPLLDTEVKHWLSAKRDIHGNQVSAGSTSHAARVVYGAGVKLGPASNAPIADCKATVWLLNHPRTIVADNVFELPNGEVLKVMRAERRTFGADTMSKVYLT